LPLEGRCIVITRAPEQAGELVAQLRDLGAEVLLLPTVSFAPAQDWAPLDAAIRQLASFDWVLLTSQNAVRYFFERCGELGVDAGADVKRPLYAAVGPATANAAEANGIAVARTAGQYRGEALARELAAETTGKRVLLPRSDRARPDLPQALRSAGATVLDVVAYRTMPAVAAEVTVLEKVRAGNVDVVAFASPSAFHHLAEELGIDGMRAISQAAAFAAIGPVTAKAIREDGCDVVIEAEESTGEGLVRAIVGHFEKQGARVK
jgi:uroporphyrinogen III methyltransferase/synthase